MNDASLSLSVNDAALEALVKRVVHETLAAVAEDQARLNGRLAFSESESAALLGLRAHQLRDLRLRGEITSSKGPGRKVMYARSDLLEFLARRRNGN
jgi:hypothetical protein